MKVRRALITLLLVCSLGATHAAAGARFAERQRLAPEEEREAREFVEALFGRLEEEQDLAPLVREMFVEDFAGRLHDSATSAGSLYFLDRAAAAQVSGEEVLRHHVAFSNFILLTSLYMLDAQLDKRAAKPDDAENTGGAGEPKETNEAKEAGGDEGAGEAGDAGLKVADILPPEVLELFKADSLLRRFAAEGEAGEAADADEDEFITTPEQLRAFTATVERANELLRQRLTRGQKKRVFDEWRSAAAKEDSRLMRPYATFTEKEWYGYPAGTRLVCVSLLMFHVELIRVGRGYKVLSMYFED